tara:strand:- start:339 stop:749 length:411 start_codon:yes stop_codon:yes gene_type:complete
MEDSKRKKFSQQYSTKRGFFSDESFLQNRWHSGINNRGRQSDERFLSYFSDSLSAGVEKGNWGFSAVFNFDLQKCLLEIKQPVLIPLPNESLKMNSFEASKLLLNVQILDWSHMAGDLFDIHCEEIADALIKFLDY